jgi:hypothetical protein
MVSVTIVGLSALVCANELQNKNNAMLVRVKVLFINNWFLS